MHSHNCGDLFGCGEEKGTGVVREDLKDAAFTSRASDRLLHMDEVDQESFDGYLTERGKSRRSLLRASSFMSVLAAASPLFSKLGFAMQASDAKKTKSSGTKHDEGRVHTVESTNETVHLGVLMPRCLPSSKSIPVTPSAIPIRGRIFSTSFSRVFR